MENKFAEGSTVIALVAPEIKLIVRRYVDRVYYCRIQPDTGGNDVVYFERELTATPGN